VNSEKTEVKTMTFDQWAEEMTKVGLFSSDDDPKPENGNFEMVDEDLMDEES
jgi:hypothetical protein